MAEEIADLLEQRGVPYALMDLDYLVWFDAGSREGQSLVLQQNIEALAANFRAAGVRLFVLAGASRDRAEVDALSASLGVPLRVVRLVVPLTEIEQRLRASASTEARLRDDLPRAAEWIAKGAGEGIEDLAVQNQGSAAKSQPRSWTGSTGPDRPATVMTSASDSWRALIADPAERDVDTDAAIVGDSAGNRRPARRRHSTRSTSRV